MPLFTAEAEYNGYSQTAYANEELDAALIAFGGAMSQSLAAEALLNLEGLTPSITTFTSLEQLHALCEELRHDGIAASVESIQVLLD